MSHPNKDLDPDCTNPAALIAALDIKAAAETYGLFVEWLKSSNPNVQWSIMDIQNRLEAIYAEVHKKHEGLRIILGIS